MTKFKHYNITDGLERKKIKHRDGHTTELQSDGQFWLSTGKDLAFFSPAYMTHHTLNHCTAPGVDPKHKKYIPIYEDILRHADDFKIKDIRVMFTSIKPTDRGQLLVVRYGYISQDHFSYLIKKRHSANTSVQRKVRLLKKSDFEMHSR